MIEQYQEAMQQVDEAAREQGQPVVVEVTTAAGVKRTFKTHALVFDIELKYVDGTNIKVADKRLLMSAVGVKELVKAGARIVIGGVRHAVIDAAPFAPGGDVLFYKSIVRAGG